MINESFFDRISFLVFQAHEARAAWKKCKEKFSRNVLSVLLPAWWMRLEGWDTGHRELSWRGQVFENCLALTTHAHELARQWLTKTWRVHRVPEFSSFLIDGLVSETAINQEEIFTGYILNNILVTKCWKEMFFVTRKWATDAWVYPSIT